MRRPCNAKRGSRRCRAAAKSAGLSVVATEEVSASAPNYTAQCLAAKQAGATVLFEADAQIVDEKVIQDCYAQGYKPKVVIDGEILLPSLTTTPAINQATYFTVPNLPYFAKNAQITAMNNALKKYEPKVLKDVNYGELPMETWVAGKMFQAAAAAGGLGANGRGDLGAADQRTELLERQHAGWPRPGTHLYRRSSPTRSTAGTTPC